MQLLLLQSQKSAVQSLYTGEGAPIPDFQQGETRNVSAAIVTALAVQQGAQLYLPKDLTGWTFRAGLGNGFLPPVAGIFTISFNGDTTGNISYNASVDQITAALNALDSIETAGGVTGGLSNGLFIFTFGETGAQPGMSGDIDNLAPLCIADFGVLIPGEENIQEVQTLRIVQNPGAWCNLSVASQEANAAVTVNRIGGSGYNHKVTIGFSSLIFGEDYQQPYDGQWTVIVGGQETVLLSWSAQAGDVQTALENLPSVGVGNVQVAEQTDGSFSIAFQGELADTDMGEIDVDASLLVVIPYLSGTLDLRTPGIDLLLGDQDQTTVYFEIEGTPPGGTVQKFLRVQVNLLDSILDPSDSTPQPFDEYYTEAQSDARYMATFVAAPASMTSAGSPGQQAFGQVSGAWYRYLCVAANTWQRNALTNF
jgi:hypothetical protein